MGNQYAVCEYGLERADFGFFELKRANFGFRISDSPSCFEFRVSGFGFSLAFAEIRVDSHYSRFYFLLCHGGGVVLDSAPRRGYRPNGCSTKGNAANG